jgi:hypothetical protein
MLARLLQPGQEFYTQHDYRVYKVMRVKLSNKNLSVLSLKATEDAWVKFPKLREAIIKRVKVRVYVEGSKYPLLFGFTDEVQLF